MSGWAASAFTNGPGLRLAQTELRGAAEGAEQYGDDGGEPEDGAVGLGGDGVFLDEELEGAGYYDESMLRYHVAFYLPRQKGEMVVAEALDFPGAVTQGFDLQDARVMIASALEDLAQSLLEEGKPLPAPGTDVSDPEADLIELVPLSVHAGADKG